MIGENPQKTNHSKIYKISEPYIPFESLEKDLNLLKTFLDNNKANEVKNLLSGLLKSYKPVTDISDHIYIEQLSSYKLKNNQFLLKD